MLFTNEDLDLIRSIAASAQDRYIAAFGTRDPAIDALLDKVNNPASDEPAPKKAKR